ncbi:hypothetical protein VdG1_08470 [Verticillium dahliae VDG1]|nr:hypothetical protein VdG1_08470 [Verticillium dahliae VDG1]
MSSAIDDLLAKYTLQPHEADASGKLLGASFTVVEKQNVSYTGGSGRQNFPQTAVPWTVRSFSWIASMTKLVTTTCLLHLVEQGKVELDVDVRHLVPRLGKMQILKGMLLTHTVGLGYDLADPDLTRWSRHIGRKDTNLDWSLDGFDTPFKFAPGEGWYYGTAVDWAGQLLEALTGNTIEAYMQDHVLDPLKMRDTGFWPGKLDHVQDRAVAWSCRGDDKTSLSPGPKLTPTTHGIVSGGAGLYSTADDYGRFLQGLLSGALVSETTLREMFTPQLDVRQSDMLNAIASQFHDMFAPEFPTDMRLDHGLGGIINMADVDGKRRKGSLSWCGMCNGRWWIDREAGVAAVLVVNVLPLGDPVVNKLFDELERAVYGGLLHAKRS